MLLDVYLCLGQQHDSLNHPELAVAAYEKGIEMGVGVLRTVGVNETRCEYQQAQRMMRLMHERGADVR